MGNSRKEIWLDVAFIALGIITMLLLFMPAVFKEYRYVGYGCAALFLVFLVLREKRRKKNKKESGKEQ